MIKSSKIIEMRKITFLLLFLLVCFNTLSQSPYDKAVEFYHNGEFNKAIPLFKEYLLELVDEDAIIDTEEYIAHSYIELGNNDLASEWTNKVLEKDSLNEFALFIALKVSASNNDASTTFRIANSLIEYLDVKEAQTYYFRGLGLISLGDYDLALKDMMKAHEFDDTHQGTNHYIGSLYIKFEEYEKAIPFLKRSIELDYRLDASYYNLAVAYFHKPEFNTTIYFLNKTIEINPAYLEDDTLQHDFNYMMGQSYYHLKKYDSTVFYLERIRYEESPHYENTLEVLLLSYYELANSYFEKKNQEIAAYFTAKSAEIFFKAWEFDKAIDLINQVIEIDSSIHYTLFKAQVMLFKIPYFTTNDMFENEQEAQDFYLSTKDAVFQVYHSVFAIDPNNEDYLNQYINDLFLLDEVLSIPEITQEICTTYDKLESLNLEFNTQVRDMFCNEEKENIEFEYNVVVFDLESYEDKFSKEKDE